jgi:hypothetical protein
LQRGRDIHRLHLVVNFLMALHLQVGYQPLAANFFFYAVIIFLLILISETLGMLCSGAFRAELTGAIVLQALYVPLLMFVGFFQVGSQSGNHSTLSYQSSWVPGSKLYKFWEGFAPGQGCG